MLSRVVLALVTNLTGIDGIVQQMAQRSRRKRNSADLPAILERAGLGSNSASKQLADKLRSGTKGQIPLEDMADGCCLRWVHEQLTVSDVVAEWHRATHPHALLL